MKIEIFKIGAVSLKHRTSIGLLVDKTEFVKTIKRLREKWNLTTLFQPGQDSQLIEYICGPDKDFGKWNNFCADIEAVRRGFNRTPNFDKVIKYALAFTEIPEGSFRSTYFKAINNSEYPDDTEYAIIVTPHSTPTEVATELKEFKQMIQDQIEYRSDKGKLERAVEKYLYEPGPAYKDFDSIDTLDRTRLWYWKMYGEQITGNTNTKIKSYERIDDELRKECPNGQDHETKIERKKCLYCGLDDINSMQHLLPKYKKALESQ